MMRRAPVFRRTDPHALPPVAIRIPDFGETPLSLDEQMIALALDVRMPRRYPRRFLWRLPIFQPANNEKANP